MDGDFAFQYMDKKFRISFYPSDATRVKVLAISRRLAIVGLAVLALVAIGWHLAEELEQRHDLILLDVNLAGMDGPATLAALRADARTSGIT